MTHAERLLEMAKSEMVWAAARKPPGTAADAEAIAFHQARAASLIAGAEALERGAEDTRRLDELDKYGASHLGSRNKKWIVRVELESVTDVRSAIDLTSAERLATFKAAEKEKAAANVREMAYKRRLREIAVELRNTMQCNCNLDNWQPEPTTGHSRVCRIHRAAIDAARKEACDV